MSVVRWIHFSDMHLGNDGAVDTRLLRKKLPNYIKGLNQSFEYIFLTGDTKEWCSLFNEETVEYIRLLCEFANIKRENLFIVPGNHDIDISNPKRNEVIEKLTNWKDRYYTSENGIIPNEDLFILKEGESEFISFISKLLGSTRAEKYKASHFVIKTSHFNILHMDSTLTYGDGFDSNFVIGTRGLMDALDQCDSDKPTIILTHYSFDYLAQKERNQVETLLREYNVKLWLAGHEHENLIRLQGDYFLECQSGNLELQDGARACFLVTEFDTATNKGIIRAHAWYQSIGWAEYPFVNRGTIDNSRYLFELKSQGALNLGISDISPSKPITFIDPINNNYEYQRIPPALTELPIPISLIGRDEIIIKIKRKLDEYNVVYIHADGGVGKTAIATAICNEYKNEIFKSGKGHFNHVAWITSSGNLKEDMSLIDIPNISKLHSSEEKYDKVCKWLSMPENMTFLVIDNMDTIPSAKERKALYTISGNTKVLITSRAKIEDFYRIDLDDLDNESAISLFYKHFLDKEELDLEELKNRPDYSEVSEIVKATSNNALLIELVGKTAFSESRDLKEYMGLLTNPVPNRDSEIVIGNHHAESHGLDPEEDNKLTMLEQIKRLYVLSGLTNKQNEIIKFFAMFPAHTKVHRQILEWCEFSKRDIDKLICRGWLKREDDNFFIHLMVKSSVELQTKETGKYYGITFYPELVIALVKSENYMPRTMAYSIIKERIIVPAVLCNLYIEINIIFPSILMLCHRIANVYRLQLGDFDMALKYSDIELNTAKRIFGEISSFAAIAYNDIAQVYDDQKDYKNALRYYLKSLEIFEKTLKNNDPVLAMEYNNVAWVCSQYGDYERAQNYYNKSVAILENTSVDQTTEAAIVYDNMGILYCYKKEYIKALQFHNKALTIITRENGENHPETAAVYNNIGVTYSWMGNYEAAISYYEKAYAIRKSILGERHHVTIETYNNLRDAYKLQGNQNAGRDTNFSVHYFDMHTFYEKAQNILGEDDKYLMKLQKNNNEKMKNQPYIREYKKIGRNEHCPCGSGKKYKNCCMGKGIFD